MDSDKRTGPVASLMVIAAILDDETLGLGVKAVLARIVCHADNGTRLAWASYKTLRKECGASRATIAKAIKLGLGKYIVRQSRGIAGSVQYRILPPPSGSPSRPPAVPSGDHQEFSQQTSRSSLSEPSEVHSVDHGGSASEPILTPKTNSTVLTPKTTPPKPPQGGSVQVKQVNPTSKRKAKPTYKPSAETLEAIYQAYPKHVGKIAALKAIEKAVRIIEQRHRVANELPSQESWDSAAAWLLARVKEYAASPKGQKPAKGQPDYRPHPATWFNAGRYDDDQSNWQDAGPADRDAGRPDLRDDSRYTEFLTGK